MLYSGETYWDKTTKNRFKFSKLKENIKTQTLIVGGGMSGNLLAYVLKKSNHDVSLIEKNTLGSGSSSANTGLLQYSSDIMISQLSREIGEDKAVSFYKMCLEAMDSLTEINKCLKLETDYKLRNSIYYASKEQDREKLIREYKLLNKYDFPVEFLDKEELKKIYKINKPCALKTWHDAEVNPYKFIQSLIFENKEMGVKYYEHTSIDLDDIGENIVKTNSGAEIEFDNIILATGYTKVYDIIKDKANVGRTYALSSKPLSHAPWKDDVMVWETKNPYLYFRTTKDHRVIAGGLDEDVFSVEKDLDKVNEKALDILREVETVIPNLDIEIDYNWSALFGSSRDGMPFIGRDPLVKNKFYLLGYEGNGTCYSMSGANIIRDLIEGIPNEYAELLRVDRKLKRDA